MTVTTLATPAEQTRARYPDQEGFVERDGVRTFYEAYGDGERTILLLPTWSLLHSRVWKAQIPYLSRHFRVVTFDGRGNGRSDRPSEPEAYAEPEFAADALAVMDATDTQQAVLVSLSRGAERSLHIGAGHPERVAGMVFIAPALPLPPTAPRRRRRAGVRDAARVLRGLGEVEHALLARALRGLPRLLHLPDLHRAALDQAARGRDRLGARDRPRDARGDPARAAAPGRGRACGS